MKEKSKDSSWGGPWTEKKLEAFGKYVLAYLKILKRQLNGKLYILMALQEVVNVKNQISRLKNYIGNSV